MSNENNFDNERIEKIKEVIKNVNERFKSGNNIPVERNFITSKEWEVLKSCSECHLELLEQIKNIDYSKITSVTIPLAKNY